MIFSTKYWTKACLFSSSPPSLTSQLKWTWLIRLGLPTDNRESTHHSQVKCLRIRRSSCYYMNDHVTAETFYRHTFIYYYLPNLTRIMLVILLLDLFNNLLFILLVMFHVFKLSNNIIFLALNFYFFPLSCFVEINVTL